MKNKLLIVKKSILAICILVLTTNAFADSKGNKKVETVIFKVEMDCMDCVNRIEQNIPFEKGVKDLQVDLENQKVEISYKSKLTNKESLQKALEKLKFKVLELKK
ncbi:cation transporter [Labilibaculum sp.]|uniref:heavy-metal-associated domain-containing protein n=1 Tax=Labilibaculum sp. TaxID=2060723 RepID=UPI00356773B0